MWTVGRVTNAFISTGAGLGPAQSPSHSKGPIVSQTRGQTFSGDIDETRLCVRQVRVRPRLRRLQGRVPAEAAVRARVHAARPVVGAVSAGVAGQPEAVQHGAGVRHARRRHGHGGRRVVDPVPGRGRGPVGRPRRRRVPRLDGGAGQRPAERVRLRVRRHIRGGNAGRTPGQTEAAAAAAAAPTAGANSVRCQGKPPTRSLGLRGDFDATVREHGGNAVRFPERFFSSRVNNDRRPIVIDLCRLLSPVP